LYGKVLSNKGFFVGIGLKNLKSNKRAMDFHSEAGRWMRERRRRLV
jgi:hypothetical protein